MKERTIKQLLLLSSMFCVGLANAKPGDSVDSGRFLGRSGQSFGQTSSEFFPMYENVPLGSQTGNDEFVEYGPFRNLSRLTIKVTVTRMEPGVHRTLLALVNSRKVADNPDQIIFIVSPGDDFMLSLKGYASISVAGNMKGATPFEVGLPGRDDFFSPVGELRNCVNLSVPPLQNNRYIYRRGTLSDRSVRRDIYLEDDFTSGPKPRVPVTCPHIAENEYP